MNARGRASYQALTEAINTLADRGLKPPCTGRSEWTSQDRKEISIAIQACLPCPLRQACCEHGRHHEKSGVWGGRPQGRNNQGENK